MKERGRKRARTDNLSEAGGFASLPLIALKTLISTSDCTPTATFIVSSFSKATSG